MTGKKIVLILVLCFMIVGTMGLVDAKMKSYDSNLKKVDIDSSFLGIKTGDIAELTLNTPLHNRVGAGYQKVAEFSVNFDKNYEDAFKKMEFYNVKNGMKGFERDFDYKYLTYETKTVNDYSYSSINNKTVKTKIGSHEETEEVWLPLTKNSFTDGEELTVGIFTIVESGDYVEWIPTFFGVEIDEWAIWEESLNVNLVAYYTMNDSSGNPIDSTGNYSTIADNITAYSSTGIVGTSLNFTRTAADNGSFVYNASNLGITDYPLSFNLWINTNTEVGAERGLISLIKVVGGGYNRDTIAIDSSNNIKITTSNDDNIHGSVTGANIVNNSWVMVTAVFSGDAQRGLWVNGVNIGNDTTDIPFKVRNQFVIGSVNTGAEIPSIYNPITAKLDEIGIWDRVLTEAEIDDLYNNGTGMTYRDVFTNAPTITANAPANNSNFTADNVTFNITASNTTTPISDVKLFINGILNNTNSSGENGTYLWTMNFADGLYNWSVGIEDTLAATVNSSLQNFTIDTTDPSITNLAPSGRQGFKQKNTNQSITWNVTDLYLDTCWYNLNGTNTIVTCADNTTNVSIQNRNYSLTFYANDTFGNEANSFIEWDYSVLEVAKVFNAGATTGSSQEFSINLTYNDTEFTNNNVLLQYNGTNYTTTRSGSSESFVFNRTIDVPIVTSETNLTFNWSITLNNGTDNTYESTSSNQTLSAISVDNCSTNTEVLYNFTIVDEKLQTILNGATQNTMANINLQLYTTDRSALVASYSSSFNETNPFSICLDNNLTDGTEYVSDVELQYSADQYVSEFYNIQNSSITNADFPTNITLYDLANTTSTTFTIKYKDANFLAVKDALIQVQRNYIDEGVFKVVELPKTDANGETVAHLVPEDVIYTFVVVKNGVVLDTFSNLIASCQSAVLGTCEITLKSFAAQIQTTDFTQLDDFAFTLTLNTSTRIITSVFSIPSGSTSAVSLNVTMLDMLGTAACTDVLTSASGTLTCTVPTGLGNKTVVAKIFKDGIEMGGGTLFLGDISPSDRFGNNLVFLSIFLFLTLIGIGIGSDPKVMAIFIFIGFIIAVAMNLISSNFIGTGATVLWLLIVIAIVLIKGGKRE